MIDGLDHLCTFFDLHHKGVYAYKDRFRVVFRALGKLTQFEDSETCNYSTKVAILDNQVFDHYINVDRRNRIAKFENDPELSDEANKGEYDKFMTNIHHVRRPLHIHPNYNHNQMKMYTHEFGSLFKNIVFMVKSRRSQAQFHICQFKGSMEYFNRQGVMDYEIVSGKEHGASVEKNRVTNFRIKWDTEAEVVESTEVEDLLENMEVTFSSFRDDLYQDSSDSENSSEVGENVFD
jgi:hypothetical protein